MHFAYTSYNLHLRAQIDSYFYLSDDETCFVLIKARFYAYFIYPVNKRGGTSYEET